MEYFKAKGLSKHLQCSSQTKKGDSISVYFLLSSFCMLLYLLKLFQLLAGCRGFLSFFFFFSPFPRTLRDVLAQHTRYSKDLWGRLMQGN